MRILFLTNFYPPHELGGQGRSCQQVVEGLGQRGHVTTVLTSMHGTGNTPTEETGVYRWLYLEMDLIPWRQSLTFFFRRKRRERHNLQCLNRLIERFRPDVIFIWGMWNLPRSLPALAEAHCPGKVVYRFADYWPTLPSQHDFYWRASGRRWFARLPKQLLGAIALNILARDGRPPFLKFEHVICVSAAVRDRLVELGIPVAHADIIHTGIDSAAYVSAQNGRRGEDDQILKLLYAGRLSPEKGVEAAIEAVARLVNNEGLKHVRLSLVGSGAVEYEDNLQRSVVQFGLSDYVIFVGQVPPGEMPRLLQEFDILLVPSVWPEPFARIVLEGMASGLAIVASSAGGTSEIVIDGENGLLFAPRAVDDLVQKIVKLAVNPALRQQLGWAGRETVLETFTVTKMMDAIENALQAVAFSTELEYVQ